MNQICVFDLNGTLLDVSALDKPMKRIFGVREMRELWFRTILHTALTLSVNGRYEPFFRIATETLATLVKAEGVALTEEDSLALLSAFQNLPAYSDARPGLAAFRDAGFRLVALTNSGREDAERNLAARGLLNYFEQVFSADEVGAAKPDPRPYAHVARALGVETKQLWLVTAHAWDTAGAYAAGWRTALIQRKENGYNFCFPEPDVFAPNLKEAARMVSAHDGFPYGKVKPHVA